MAHRDHTRVLKLGPLALGGGHPVLVQSMTNTDTRDVEATLHQLHALADAGCEIARLAVPDDKAAARPARHQRSFAAPSCGGYSL